MSTNLQVVGTLTFTDAANGLPIKLIITVTPTFQVATEIFVNNVSKGTITESSGDALVWSRALNQFAGVARTQGG